MYFTGQWNQNMTKLCNDIISVITFLYTHQFVIDLKTPQNKPAYNCHYCTAGLCLDICVHMCKEIRASETEGVNFHKTFPLKQHSVLILKMFTIS